MKGKPKKNDEEVYIKEINLENSPKELSLEQNEFICKQMKNSVCKIKCKKGGTGSGFFCYIPFPDKTSLLPVLITNYHVLNKDDVIEGKQIEFSLGNNNIIKNIRIKASRKIYTNEKPYDITIIEIKKGDGLKFSDFMELDDGLFESNKDVDKMESKEYNNLMDKKFRQKTVYLIHYPDGKNVKYSLGVIKNIDEDGFNIRHLCNSHTGSSGGPLICLINFKVMGIHKGFKDKKKFNLGTLLNSPVQDFYDVESLKKEEFFEGGFGDTNVIKTAQNFQVDYKKLTFNQKHENVLKEKKQNEFYTIKDLNKMITIARECAILGKYEKSFEKFSLGILIIKYRIREIMNTDKKLREKWELLEKEIKEELDEVIELMKINQTFLKIHK